MKTGSKALLEDLGWVQTLDSKTWDEEFKVFGMKKGSNTLLEDLG